MAAYAALLRAVNVGGTGKLAMTELRRLCEGCGFDGVATYIQSGNVVFQTRRSEASAQKQLAAALAEKIGKPVGVFLRSGSELDGVLEANPFPDAPPNRVLVYFTDAALKRSELQALATAPAPGGEQVEGHGREVFVFYPEGMGRSKLALPVQKTGTGRNLNTVRKLRELLRGLE